MTMISWPCKVLADGVEVDAVIENGELKLPEVVGHVVDIKIVTKLPPEAWASNRSRYLPRRR